MMKSSFVRKVVPKKDGAVNLPNATKPSIHNGQLLISTGLHELDEILGGGVAVGTVVLVEEDENSSYYSALLKYYVSEFNTTCTSSRNFSLFLFQPNLNRADVNTQHFLQNLPRNLTKELVETPSQVAPSTEEKKASGTGMTIAWQYEKYLNQSASSTSQSSVQVHRTGSLQASTVKTFCHSYDMSRQISPDALNSKLISTLDVKTLEQDKLYQNLYASLHKLIDSEFRSDNPGRNILRLAIHSIATPLWTEYNESGDRALLLFMHALRGLLRSSLAVCMISFPSHLYSETFVRKVRHLCDTVVAFESFSALDHPVSEAFSDYSGQFFIKKLPRLNSLVTFQPDTLNFVFKQRRRKLHIEMLHLGPAETRSTKEKSGSAQSVKELLCAPGPTKTSKLDF